MVLVAEAVVKNLPQGSSEKSRKTNCDNQHWKLLLTQLKVFTICSKFWSCSEYFRLSKTYNFQ